MRFSLPYRQGLYIRRDKWPPSISSLLLHLRVNNDVLERPTILSLNNFTQRYSLDEGIMKDTLGITE